jgi:hypothetical protein
MKLSALAGSGINGLCPPASPVPSRKKPVFFEKRGARECVELSALAGSGTNGLCDEQVKL